MDSTQGNLSQPISHSDELISGEVFTFKGGGDETVSPSVKEDIQAAHRRHIEDFKSFAENQ